MKKTTICILHGWSLEPDLKKRWQSLINLLQKEGFQVKYLSLPGFDQPISKPLTLDQYQEHVLHQIKNETSIILLGHSFGGQLATRVASSRPKNLSALILVAPSGIIDRSLTKSIKRTIFILLAKVGKIVVNNLPSFIQQKSKKLLYLLAREKDYLNAPNYLKKTMSNILADEITDDLPKINVPTLIIWGEKDRFTPIKNATIFATGIHKAQLKTISNEKHRPYFTQPKLVASHIIHFLSKHVF